MDRDCGVKQGGSPDVYSVDLWFICALLDSEDDFERN